MKRLVTSRGAIAMALYLGLFVCLSYLYMRVAMRVPVNSDGASALLIARDIAAGNVFLQGWSLSTVSFYFTELLPFAIAIKLVGWHTGLSYLVPAMLLALAVLLSFHLCVGERPKANWPLLVLIAAPGFAAANLVLVPSMHMGAYVAGLVCWVLVRQYRESGSVWVLGLIWLLLSVTLFSDDIARYFLLVPLCVTSAWFAYRRRSWRDLSILACSVLALVGAKAVSLVFMHFGGFELPGLKEATFASFEALGHNFSLALEGTFTFFGANFFGRPILSLQGLLTAARAVLVVGLAVGFVAVARRFLTLDFYAFAWLVSALIMLAAYVLSDLPVNLMTTRYLVPVFIFGCLLIARDYPVTEAFRCWCFLIAVGYCGAFLFELGSRPIVAEHANPLVAELEKRNLRSGYATFWNASSIAFVSGARVAPVVVNSVVEPMRWLSNREWYEGRADFLILETPQQVEAAQAQLGDATELLIIGGKYLLIWNKGFALLER